MEWSKTLTKKQAKLIKKFRVTGYPITLPDGKTELATGTWRKVATLFGEAYPDLDVCKGNQLEGMELCDAAMKLLGETHGNGWN